MQAWFPFVLHIARSANHFGWLNRLQKEKQKQQDEIIRQQRELEEKFALIAKEQVGDTGFCRGAPLPEDVPWIPWAFYTTHMHA